MHLINTQTKTVCFEKCTFVILAEEFVNVSVLYYWSNSTPLCKEISTRRQEGRSVFKMLILTYTVVFVVL